MADFALIVLMIQILDPAKARWRIACGPQEILECMRADLAPHHRPLLARAAEVHPGIDARVGGLLRSLRETGERALDAGMRFGARYGEAYLISPEESGQYLGPGGAQDGVERWIFRMARRL